MLSIFCITLLICGIVLAFVLPMGYVSTLGLKKNKQMKIRFISLALVKTINHFYFVVSPQVPWLHSVYAVLGAILFTMVSTMQF